jgi:hypothetical protein
MTFDEVRSELGEPHEKLVGDRSTSWRYYVRSSFSPFINGFFAIEFDRNGRMISYWIP